MSEQASKPFIEELRWRGLLQDMTPGVEEYLDGPDLPVAYVGFDPTAASLHIGNLVTIMLLVHFQRHGYKPLALVGGATGMIGDPSGRQDERQLLSVETLRHNQAGIRKQLEHFLRFDDSPQSAEMLNNYDWTSRFDLLTFLREVGKHISVNYMMAKDSVKLRLEKGISYTEFTYQLLQANDFFWLFENKNCRLQMGGSDQWGNITSGTELIRRKVSGSAYALVCPLITRADGSKFGKSAGQNIWLDAQMTSPYRFYQYWLNTSDEDAVKYIRIFTLLSRQEIETLTAEHEKAPHLRLLQKALAKDVTRRVHSEEAWLAAEEASNILFGRGTKDALRSLSEEDLLSVFDGVPRHAVPTSVLDQPQPIIELLTTLAPVFSSKAELRRLIQNNGLSINKEKISAAEHAVCRDDLLQGKYLLIQKGKKNYELITVQ
jgi:tyrosyl-tRNA synthetase